MRRQQDPAAEIHEAVEAVLDSYRRGGTGERLIVDALHRAIRGSAIIVATAKAWGADGERLGLWMGGCPLDR